MTEKCSLCSRLAVHFVSYARPLENIGWSAAYCTEHFLEKFKTMCRFIEEKYKEGKML